MQKHRIIVGFLLVLGVLLLIENAVYTGAVIGVGDVYSIIRIVLSLLFIVAAFVVSSVSGAKYSLEDIFNGSTSKVFKKSARYMGGGLLKKNMGSLPRQYQNDKELRSSVHRELFNLTQLERRRRYFGNGDEDNKDEGNTGISPEERKAALNEIKNFEDRYTRHLIDVPELTPNKVISFDAKVLSTGNRGAFRYLFDESTGRYLGLAEHRRSQGKVRYYWAG